MRMWKIVGVETELEWPMEETQVSFMGHPLFLRPPEGESDADVRLQYDHPEDEKDAFGIICRFLSALSWWRRCPVLAKRQTRCTGPLRVGKWGNGPPLCRDYRAPTGLTAPTDPKERRALALYREAIGIGSTPYEFLGYCKIIESCYSNKREQIEWMNETIAVLSDKRAQARLAELGAEYSDIGDYLYGSGRCAVAHAAANSTVDPDDPKDTLRLSEDMPVVRSLAEYIIEKELKIPWEFSA